MIQRNSTKEACQPWEDWSAGSDALSKRECICIAAIMCFCACFCIPVMIYDWACGGGEDELRHGRL
jgi:hypothetical protein